MSCHRTWRPSGSTLSVFNRYDRNFFCIQMVSRSSSLPSLHGENKTASRQFLSKKFPPSSCDAAELVSSQLKVPHSTQEQEWRLGWGGSGLKFKRRDSVSLSSALKSGKVSKSRSVVFLRFLNYECGWKFDDRRMVIRRVNWCHQFVAGKHVSLSMFIDAHLFVSRKHRSAVINIGTQFSFCTLRTFTVYDLRKTFVLCMYLYIYMHIFAHMQIFAHICAHLYIFVHVQLCTLQWSTMTSVNPQRANMHQ